MVGAHMILFSTIIFVLLLQRCFISKYVLVFLVTSIHHSSIVVVVRFGVSIFILLLFVDAGRTMAMLLSGSEGMFFLHLPRPPPRPSPDH